MLSVFGAAPALAFQQERVGGSQADAVSETTAAGANSGELNSNLTGSDTSSAKSKKESGAKLSIPGLGTVGVLPKMDFGLELLYGSNQPNADVTEQDEESDDLRIRGSIKHRF
ncbi:MAG: hypothetical protein AAGD43_28345 [Pseudomonadota bacterium]